MELNGARSNPRLQLELFRLSAVYARLLRKAAKATRNPRPAPPSFAPVLAAVTHVLGIADRPMTIGEIHRAAEELADQPLLRASVKAALAAATAGRRPRFRRVRRGVYRSVVDSDRATVGGEGPRQPHPSHLSGR